MTNELTPETLSIDMGEDVKVAATATTEDLYKMLKKYHSTHNKFGIDDIMLWLKDSKLIN